ncbi:hypothetical protein HK096_007009, partial [Nowakowskiella sp. JEL0078]
FAPLHPGGILAIKHMAAKDATDVIIAFHPAEALARMKPFQVGYLLPSEIRTTQISKDYRVLEKKLKDGGYFETNYWFFIREFIKFFALWFGMIYFAAFGPKKWWSYVISCSCSAVLWQQAAFVAHDLGHNGVTHNRRIDKLIAVFLADFMGGLSIGWWKSNHNTHHIVTNDPEHDPDIQHVPFFAISPMFFKNLYSTYYNITMEFDNFAKLIIPQQHRIFYIVLAFGRFNLYALSFGHLLKRQFGTPPKGQDGKPVSVKAFREDVLLELSALGLFWCWYGWLLAQLPNKWVVLVYFLVSNMLTGLLHVQITISHFGMPANTIVDEGFAELALNTSMDVECPRWLDWLHGGLQFQVVHHLFPRMPRHHLRSVKPLVQKLANDNGLKYHSHGFVKSNLVVLSTMQEVAEQIKFLVKASPELLAH